MKQLARFAFLAAALVPAACGKSSDKAAPAKSTPVDAGPPPDAPPPSPMAATIEGKPYTFPGVTISAATQRDVIKLSTRAGGCGTEEVDGDVVLDVRVAAGPGGKHFAPGPHAVGVSIKNEKEDYASDGRELTGVLWLDATEWKAGAKVKGVLKFDDLAKAADESYKQYSGYGAFEAEVCDVSTADWRYQPTPEQADAGPAKGEGGGIKFAFKSGVAVMRHDDARKLDRIEELHLFDADVTCDTFAAAKGPHVRLKSPGGASGPRPLIGTPQDVEVTYKEDGKADFDVYGPAWIKFDTLELKEGTEAKGTVHAESSTAASNPMPPSRLSGGFTVKVCKG